MNDFENMLYEEIKDGIMIIYFDNPMRLPTSFLNDMPKKPIPTDRRQRFLTQWDNTTLKINRFACRLCA